MRELWWWFGNNSSQLQAIGSIAAAFAAAALCVVAVRQAHAADAQASAALAQVAAADRQTATSILIADKQTSPNISITAAQARDGILIKDAFAMLNNGNGTAKDVKLTYRDQNIDSEIQLRNDVLVVRDSLEVRFDGARGAQSGFRLTYSTQFGTRYALEFQWNGNSSRPVNEKLIVVSSANPLPADVGSANAR
jgi:hypothetical protein